MFAGQDEIFLEIEIERTLGNTSCGKEVGQTGIVVFTCADEAGAFPDDREHRIIFHQALPPHNKK